MIEFRKSIAELYKTAFQDIDTAYDNKDALYNDRISYIEGYMDIEDTKGNIVPLNAYSAIIDEAKAGQANSVKNIQDLTAQMEAGIASGTLTDEDLVEMEAAIREEEAEWQNWTKIIAENEKAMQDWYSNGMSLVSDAHDDLDGLFGRRKDYIETYMELLELQGETVSIGHYNELIANEEQAIANKEKENEFLKAEIGNLEEGSEAWKEHTEKIQANEQAILDGKVQLEQYNEEIKELVSAAWDKVMGAYNNRTDFFENQLSFVDSYIGRLEALNIDVPDEVYDKQIEIQEIANDSVSDQLASAYAKLADIRDKHGADSQEYYDKVSEITALESQLYEGQTKVLELQQQKIQQQYELFDRFIDRINNSINELENISGLISDEDVAHEDGTWTDEGITSLGLLVHQMEINKQLTEEYNNEMEKLNEQYANGEISELAYYERLQELEDGQWDAINAYKSAEDAIVDLNEARIDMIEEGFNKEIEAYQELIDLKKEELDAERD
jgi:hypothetical protein